MTRQQIIQALNSLPDSVLERLYRLSDKIITPDEFQLTAVTFEQIVDRAHQLANQYFPEWTDRSKEDFGQFLVELYAYFTESKHFYLNAFGNEAYINRASTYSVLWSLAIARGRTPRLRTGATAFVDVEFESAPTETVVKRGEIVVASSQDPDVVFSNLEDITVPASNGSTIIRTTFINGLLRTENPVFKSYSLRIRQNDVLIDTIRLRVAGAQSFTDWQRVDSFSNSTQSSPHFTVVPGQNSTARILFGIDGYGVRPQRGSVCEVTYFKGGGVQANGLPAGTLTQLQQSPVGRRVANISNATTTAGGKTQEGFQNINGIEELRQNTLGWVRGRGNVVVPEDAKIFLEEQSEVLKATAYSWNRYLFFSAHPNPQFSGSPFTIAQMQDLAQRLKDVTVGNYIIQPVLTTYTSIGNIVLTAYVQGSFLRTDAIIRIRTALKERTNIGAEGAYGDTFVPGVETQRLLSRIQGLQNVVWNSIQSVQGNPPPTVVLPPSAVFAPLQDSQITVNVLGGA